MYLLRQITQKDRDWLRFSVKTFSQDFGGVGEDDEGVGVVGADEGAEAGDFGLAKGDQENGARVAGVAAGARENGKATV